MTERRLDDLEAYVRGLPAQDVAAWLAQAFPAARVRTRERGRVLEVLADPVIGHAGDRGPVQILVMEDAAQGFTSVWLRSGIMPWPDDLGLARALHTWSGREVRCTTGAWQPGEAEDWWQLDAAGERTIGWPDA